MFTSEEYSWLDSICSRLYMLISMRQLESAYLVKLNVTTKTGTVVNYSYTPRDR